MELSKRQIMLLSLLDSQKSYCTVDAIARHLGVSKRTVHHELERIKPFISQNNKRLKKKRGVGIKITEAVSPIRRHHSASAGGTRLTVEARRLDILYKLLFEERKVTHNELAENYFVSKSSIQNDLNFINRNIIKLTGGYDGTYISAQENEWQAAHLKFNQYVIALDTNLTDKSQELKKYYPAEIVCRCHDILFEYIQNNLTSISDIYIQNIQSILIILMYRMRKGYHHSDLESVNTETDPDTRNILEMIDKIAQKLNVQPTRGDIGFLLTHLFLNRFNLNSANNINYESITMTLINEVERLMDLPFSADKQLYRQLLLHIPPMITRLRTGNQVKNLFTQEIKNELILTYNILLMAVKNLEQSINVQFNEDEIAFLALYFQVAQERIQTPRRILVVCPMGIAASELLINRIRKIIPVRDILQSASIAELETLNLAQFDFVLSTVELKGIEREWFKISLFINDLDIGTLLSLTKAEYPQENTGENFSVADLSEKYYRIISTDAPNKEQLLRTAVDGLIAEHKVSERFFTSVLERETLSSTDLPVGVATPHGSADYIHQTSISIIRNKRKIKWKNYYVDIIFLICIAKKDTLKTKRIISRIYRMIDSPVILNTLRQSA